MSLWEIDPSGPLHQLRREMDRVLDGFVGGGNRGIPFVSRHQLPVNVWQDERSVHVEVEVPGLTIQDVDVQIDANSLSIKARHPEVDSDNLTFIKQERAGGEIVREVKMPTAVDAEQATAVLKDGLLKISLPISQADSSKKIAISGE